MVNKEHFNDIFSIDANGQMAMYRPYKKTNNYYDSIEKFDDELPENYKKLFLGIRISSLVVLAAFIAAMIIF